MSIQVVMVGMDHWFQQDVVPLQELFKKKYGLQTRSLKSLHNASGKEVCDALKFDKAPEMLIFYYTGHGSFDNGHFKFSTQTTLSDHKLSQAIESTGATKVLIIIDACHAGGFVVKDDVEERLSRLASGRGTVVLGACAAAATTAGSSPLTKALKDVLVTKDQLEPDKLRELVKKQMSSAVLIMGPSYQPFSLDHGMTTIVSCRNGFCAAKHQQVQEAVNYGDFDILNHDPQECTLCKNPLRAESLHFTNCTWQVKYGYQEGTSVVRQVTKPMSSATLNHWSLDRSALEGYRYLHVFVVP